uniref:Uncharacterized protein n=1 Tax=Anguilla anguilla TaxID=7936 RepID=A0A0E9XVG0_ANGAN
MVSNTGLAPIHVLHRTYQPPTPPLSIHDRGRNLMNSASSLYRSTGRLLVRLIPLIFSTGLIHENKHTVRENCNTKHTRVAANVNTNDVKKEILFTW